MADANGEYPTVIGPDASVKGEVKFEKGLRLLGQFDGEIASKGNLLVAEGARLTGEVKAGSVRIDGTMSGNLEVTGKVHLTASAKLEGDLRTARLEVADGATFVGRVAVGTDKDKDKAPSRSGEAPSPAVRNLEKPKSVSQNQPVAAGKR